MVEEDLKNRNNIWNFNIVFSIKLPMLLAQITTKISYLLTLLVALYFANIYITHTSPLPDDLWHYYIPHQEF